MSIFDFLFGGGELADLKESIADPAEVRAYVQGKLDEAADWRDGEWAELEARQQRIADLNDQLLDLRDQANGK